MNRFGFVRITCVCPITTVADPLANASEAARLLGGLADSDVVVFPELGLTGYTCGDLFGQTTLLRAAEEGAKRVAEATRGRPQLVVVGLPVAVGNRLYNCGLAIADGAFLGLVPKQFLPNYREFYEKRWFSAGFAGERREVEFAGGRVAFGTDLLFDAGGDVTVGVEICEDLWVPIPPSSSQAVAGATVLVNLSASNETVGRSYRSWSPS